MKEGLAPRSKDRTWVRGCAIEELEAASVAALSREYDSQDRWTPDGGYDSPAQWLAGLLESVREEIAGLDDLPAAAHFAYGDTLRMTPAVREVFHQPHSIAVLGCFAENIHRLERTRREEVAVLFRDLRAHFRACYGMRGRDVMMPVRAALTGDIRGPCLEVVVCLLGRARTLERVRRQLEILREAYNGAACV